MLLQWTNSPDLRHLCAKRIGSADGKATIKISGTAQDAICGRVVPFDRLLDPLVETATQPVNSDVCVPIESTALKDGATL